MVVILSALWWRKIRGLWKLPDGRDWLKQDQGKLGLVLIGGAMFSKTLIQFSADGQGCVPSLLLDLRPNYGRGNEDKGFPGGSDSKSICLQCRWPGFNPWVGKIPGEENGNPLQYSCLENPMDRGAWQTTVLGVTKSQMQLSDWTTTIKGEGGSRGWLIR